MIESYLGNENCDEKRTDQGKRAVNDNEQNQKENEGRYTCHHGHFHNGNLPLMSVYY
ncbi:hypothetical protein [Salimicrobium humidisoli]|uniref:hypothetical protein n=1 Tax=Salimicrobium humidisoli TaxID=2029857 RepID=UPI0013045D80|nr:hypothetical protein [Salimicrobium humidisoli]